MTNAPDLEAMARAAAADEEREPDPPSLRLQPKPLIDKETD